METVIPVVLREIVAIDTKGQCKCRVALVNTKAYCSVVCKGFFLDWDGVTEVDADVAILEALDVCLKAKSLVWDGRSPNDEHVCDMERPVLRG
jgi:hypothetical protein